MSVIGLQSKEFHGTRELLAISAKTELLSTQKTHIITKLMSAEREEESASPCLPTLLTKPFAEGLSSG